MAKLTYKQKTKTLPSSDFVFPKKRKYPIPDKEYARDVLTRAAQNLTGRKLQKVREAVHRRYPDIEVTGVGMSANVSKFVELYKDDEHQIVYGVVMSPELEDSQGDVVSAQDIETVAHRFLVEYRKHDVQHDERDAAVETVESFIAPQDMLIAGKPVLKGAWVLATHVSDRKLWKRVRKGEFTGYSIGGTGTRSPL